jgi:hypothetical protein
MDDDREPLELNTKTLVGPPPDFLLSLVALAGATQQEIRVATFTKVSPIHELSDTLTFFNARSVDVRIPSSHRR